MIMGISRVYMIIYGILVYHMFRHTHIFHAKVLSKEFHWQNATLHIASTATWWMQASCPCGMRVYPLVVVRDPALQYIHVLKKKDSSGCCMYQLSGTSKWLLPQWSTAQNLPNFWQATRFLCHPVPLSIGAVGNVMSICVQRLTITKTVRSCEGLWRIYYLPSQPNCIPPSSARHSMRSMQFVYRSQIFSSGESQFTQNGDIRVSLWIEDNSSMAGHWVWLSHNLQSEHIELVKKMPWRYWSYSVILVTILLEVGNKIQVSLQDGPPQLQVGL